MKKKQEILEMCINKELEPHRVTCQYVRENPLIDGQDWFSHFTFKSKEEFDEWKSFCITLFRKELKYSKIQSEREFDWVNLMYGLKQEYVKEKA